MNIIVKNKPLIVLIRITSTFLLSLWLLGIISPCLSNEYFKSFYPFSKVVYSTTCHQLEYKSFNCDGVFFLVCARCTGIYAGALFSGFLLAIYNKQFRLRTKYLIILSVPMLLDVILLNVNAYQYSKFFSGLTGFLFGSAVFIYILSAIENLLFIKQK